MSAGVSPPCSPNAKSPSAKSYAELFRFGDSWQGYDTLRLSSEALSNVEFDAGTGEWRSSCQPTSDGITTIKADLFKTSPQQVADEDPGGEVDGEKQKEEKASSSRSSGEKLRPPTSPPATPGSLKSAPHQASREQSSSRATTAASSSTLQLGTITNPDEPNRNLTTNFTTSNRTTNPSATTTPNPGTSLTAEPDAHLLKPGAFVAMVESLTHVVALQEVLAKDALGRAAEEDRKREHERSLEVTSLEDESRSQKTRDARRHIQESAEAIRLSRMKSLEEIQRLLDQTRTREKTRADAGENAKNREYVFVTSEVTAEAVHVVARPRFCDRDWLLACAQTDESVLEAARFGSLGGDSSTSTSSDVVSVGVHLNQVASIFAERILTVSASRVEAHHVRLVYEWAVSNALLAIQALASSLRRPSAIARILPLQCFDLLSRFCDQHLAFRLAFQSLLAARITCTDVTDIHDDDEESVGTKQRVCGHLSRQIVRALAMRYDSLAKQSLTPLLKGFVALNRCPYKILLEVGVEEISNSVNVGSSKNSQAMAYSLAKAFGDQLLRCVADYADEFAIEFETRILEDLKSGAEGG
ncbi:unnamed protein product [Amoebophrya sp. A25]|nr:unnamed protein product [Amoebophrya sp. A25]|eukprot:GSA25T00016810001.1